MSPSLFPPLDEKNLYQYRAVGVVRGRYYPSTVDFNQGTLVTNESVIQAVINSKPNRAPKITPDCIENELLFCVYPRTRKDKDMSRVYLYAVGRKMERDIKSDRTFTIPRMMALA